MLGGLRERERVRVLCDGGAEMCDVRHLVQQQSRRRRGGAAARRRQLPTTSHDCLFLCNSANLTNLRAYQLQRKCATAVPSGAAPAAAGSRRGDGSQSDASAHLLAGPGQRRR